MINGDSQEYDLLQEACDMKQVDPHQDSIITVEIGVREGLGSKIILDTCIHAYIYMCIVYIDISFI